MNQHNLANLTTQYQQVYLVYCYKVMQYLQALAWLSEQQSTKVKPKSASGVKKLAQTPNQEKPTFKSLKHQEKPNVSTIVAMGFPNGAMSAAFRVAFNDWYDDLFDRLEANRSGDELKKAKAKSMTQLATEAVIEPYKQAGKAVKNSAITGLARSINSSERGTVSIDAFAIFVGGAIDVTNYNDCSIINVCSQLGFGFQVSGSYTENFSLGINNSQSFNSPTLGVFADGRVGAVGMGGSIDYNFQNNEIQGSVDIPYLSLGIGAAAGVQACSTLGQAGAGCD